MPRIRKYIGGSGLYIRASSGGKIATYQVTPDGMAILRQRGLGDGARMTTRDLIWMRERGFVITGGSGPGDIAPLPADYLADSNQFARTQPNNPTTAKSLPWGSTSVSAQNFQHGTTSQQRQPPDAGTKRQSNFIIMYFVFLLVLLIPVTLLVASSVSNGVTAAIVLTLALVVCNFIAIGASAAIDSTSK